MRSFEGDGGVGDSPCSIEAEAERQLVQTAINPLQSREQVAAHILAAVAVQIVASNLSEEFRYELFRNPYSSVAEARVSLAILQSQPRRRGRPKKVAPDAPLTL